MSRERVAALTGTNPAVGELQQNGGKASITIHAALLWREVQYFACCQKCSEAMMLLCEGGKSVQEIRAQMSTLQTDKLRNVYDPANVALCAVEKTIEGMLRTMLAVVAEAMSSDEEGMMIEFLSAVGSQKSSQTFLLLDCQNTSAIDLRDALDVEIPDLVQSPEAQPARLDEHPGALIKMMVCSNGRLIVVKRAVELTTKTNIDNGRALVVATIDEMEEMYINNNVVMSYLDLDKFVPKFR